MKERLRENRKKMALVFMRYAAVFVVALVSAYFIAESRMFSGRPVIAMQTLTVPSGQRAHITLPDGSSVWVNAGSTLKYPSTFEDERRVSVSGEALFEVAKDKEHPFIVSTGKMDVKALGTKFDVFNYPSHPLSVTLFEGSIHVYKLDNENTGYVLSPNECITEVENGYQVSAISDEATIWISGLYAFNRVKLKVILDKLELYYDTKIIVKCPAILDYEFTGKFRQRDGIMEVLRLIRKIYPFKIQKDEDTNTITLY
jgi:ferric-dicitrate binding protein FerR (iron transport regulator)